MRYRIFGLIKFDDKKINRILKIDYAQYVNKGSPKKRPVFILLFIQFVSLLTFSQTDNANFSHLTTSDGLSQSTVSSILKDQNGFMWFATRGGLNKYDGYKFIIYNHDQEKPASISDDNIAKIMEDDKGNLWVGTQSGLDKYDRKKDNFIHYRPGKSTVNDVFQDSRKRIWAATSNGLYLLDTIDGSFRYFKHNIDDTNSLSDDIVYKITEDNYGDMWLATKNGLNRLDLKLQRFIHYKNDPLISTSIGGDWVRTVYKDSKGNIWAGTLGNGISLFNRKKNSFTNYRHDVTKNNSLCLNDILSFCEDYKGNLWIGTENGGISVFNPADNIFATYKNDPFNNRSIGNNSIYSIYKDDQETMWIGTYADGINILLKKGDKFTHYNQDINNLNSLSNKNVLAITGDSNGDFWIGTDGGGLNKFNEKSQKFTHYLNDINNKNSVNSNYVITVIEVAKNLIALGTVRAGFDLFNTKTGLFLHHLPEKGNLNSLSVSTVNILLKNNDGNLWIGTWGGGLDFYNIKQNHFTHFVNQPKDSGSLTSNFINCLLIDSDKTLWVGSGTGLDKFNNATNTFTHYRHSDADKKSINNNNVQSIFEDHAHNLWFGTGGGINLFDKKNQTFTGYTEKDGLANNMIQSIKEDAKGNLWLASNGGITKFDPGKNIFRNYDAADGVQGKEFKTGASFETAEGEMYFGGTNGFNTFFPDSVTDNNFIPPVYITGFQIFNRPVSAEDKDSPLQQQISEVKEIILSYQQSVFSFEFAALNYTLPGKNQYAYKLENFDKEWTFSGNKRTATYTNLDPGTYIFKVQGSNNDHVWNKEGASIKIIITPPFWLTWWFKIMAVVIVVGGVLLFYGHRITGINNQKINLEKRVNEQTFQLLKSTKEEQKARSEAEQANIKLEIKNKELEQFAYIASHDLQEPLRTTSSFIGLLQKQYKGKLDDRADKYFKFILDASDRMKILIKNLLDYSRIGNGTKVENVDCNIILENVLADLHVAIKEAKADISFAALPVINGHPTEMKQLFQNLLINAIKFRKNDTAPEIKIGAQKLQKDWQFMFTDNGIGIEEQHLEKIFNIFQRLHTSSEYEGSGIGLSYCKKIVELHHGKIWVESMPGTGSTFYFTVPINSTL